MIGMTRFLSLLLLSGINHIGTLVESAVLVAKADDAQESSYNGLRQRQSIDQMELLSGSPERHLASSFAVAQQYVGIGERDVQKLAGGTFSIASPSGAVSRTTLVSVTNEAIAIQTKKGVFQYRSSLANFFKVIGSPFPEFVSKVVYDQYADRFVVTASYNAYRYVEGLGKDITNSTLYVAVSKTGSPAGYSDWYIQSINTYKANPVQYSTFIGLGLGPEALYLTTFATGFPNGRFLYTISKTNFYKGGKISYTTRNATAALPSSTSSILRNQVTYQTDLTPARGYGGAIGRNIGTFLVGYDGLAVGNSSYLYIVTVKNPSGSPTLSGAVLNLGQINQVKIVPPSASQLGSTGKAFLGYSLISDVVWRSNALWVVLQVVPFRGPNANQVVAKWIKISTDTLNNKFAVADQGEIGAKDLGKGTFTYFPSVAVNSKGVAAFGFGASGPSIYFGAYVVGRAPTDPKGNVSKTYVVKAGVDTSNGPPPLGFTSSVALDPADDSFWVYNQYAAKRDSSSSSTFHEGVWGTAWRRFYRTS